MRERKRRRRASWRSSMKEGELLFVVGSSKGDEE